ncbi:MAG: hypothetical protein HC889_05415 [Synechococcaceae cyanobacterium SM1_2_3]|nr:hypothetical protein [Synechococcaceae cyanobacterium SM1_2_3]
MPIQNRISTLDDATACRVLATFARAQANPAETALTPELRQALREFAPAPEAAAVAASEGDLARAALILLADDPQYQPILTALIEGPAPAQFGPAKTAAVIAAVLIVLQTAVAFERDKDGRWSIEIKKQPTDSSLLEPLVQKLLGVIEK